MEDLLPELIHSICYHLTGQTLDYGPTMPVQNENVKSIGLTLPMWHDDPRPWRQCHSCSLRVGYHLLETLSRVREINKHWQQHVQWRPFAQTLAHLCKKSILYWRFNFFGASKKMNQ